jgi:hypothetical protein
MNLKGKRDAEERLLACLTTKGARPQRGAKYKNNQTKFPTICAKNHMCVPWPVHVTRGGGVCRRCACAGLDRVYLVLHESAEAIKIGVASGEGRVRGHERRGYSLVAQWVGLSHESARGIEGAILSFWRSNGWERVESSPKDGRTETISVCHLASTLDQLRVLGVGVGEVALTGCESLAMLGVGERAHKERER